ncbi:MAG: threonylcarbamoyl-AMP synthase [Deltaproteobacteria bacterium]|nr:threonylcarbamoyl-AMP synthase [Deltaproteobacteria bacterium]
MPTDEREPEPEPERALEREAALEREVREAGLILRRGGLVAFPTETVYGLGAHAMDPKAVARIFEVKARPRFDPLIVHVRDIDAARALVTDFPPVAEQLAQAFWPGPLTMVLPKAAHVPDLVTAGEPTVALRVPRHPIAAALLEHAGCPIAAPSANRFGRTSPTTAAHVRAQLEVRSGAVEMLLDGGPTLVGVESTVITFIDDEVWLLRPGGLPLEDIEPIAGPVRIAPPGTKLKAAPGRSVSHYAPKTPLVLDPKQLPAGGRFGWLQLKPRPAPSDAFVRIEVLSSTGDLNEAAARLFAAMQRLDHEGLDAILADRVPEVGLGRAIMDRLRRAAGEEIVVQIANPRLR